MRRESAFARESLGLTAPEGPGRSEPHEIAETRKMDHPTFRVSIE